jgi:signal transduction histidine kinase
VLFANIVDFHEQGQKLAGLVEGEILSVQEILFKRRGGTEITCETIVTPVREHKSKLLGYVRIIRNISERKAAEAQTIALAQERNRTAVLAKFLTDASHDFRHPLSRMTTQLYILERKAARAGLEGGEGHFSAIREQISKVDNLLDDLLLMIRLDTGIAVDVHPAYLNPLLEAVFEEWRPKAFQKNITLKMDLSESPTVKIDVTLLRIAIGHLIENAIRYSKSGDEVTLSSLSDGQVVYIHVQDNGIGINEFDQKHIFERFYTVDESRNDKTSGTGLGLAIAKRIVELCGGSIGVASELGEGSIFHIILPVWTD